MHHNLVTGHPVIVEHAMEGAGFSRLSLIEWGRDGERVRYVADYDHVRGQNGHGCKLYVCTGCCPLIIREARYAQFTPTDDLSA